MTLEQLRQAERAQAFERWKRDNGYKAVVFSDCTATRWAIAGDCGRYLYVGQCLTRKDAIREHCIALGKFWPECRRKGDRAVKVTITWPKK